MAYSKPLSKSIPLKQARGPWIVATRLVEIYKQSQANNIRRLPAINLYGLRKWIGIIARIPQSGESSFFYGNSIYVIQICPLSKYIGAEL
ncbi:MAG TPA: hypothetical protein DCS93_19835 [Microscillaceae bacterium]|nr:hypothetical protein [Microscillaceae bacterium]